MHQDLPAHTACARSRSIIAIGSLRDLCVHWQLLGIVLAAASSADVSAKGSVQRVVQWSWATEAARVNTSEKPTALLSTVLVPFKHFGDHVVRARQKPFLIMFILRYRSRHLERKPFWPSSARKPVPLLTTEL